MNIANLNKAEVLAALYNRAQPQGLGFLHYTLRNMTVEQAQEILDGGTTYFDYLKGRVMKVDLSGDDLHTILYNRNNGPEAAEMALSVLTINESSSIS